MAAHYEFQFGPLLLGDSNKRRILAGILFFVSAVIASASAQDRPGTNSFQTDRLQAEPSTAAVGPGYDVNLGYIFHTMVIPGSGSVTLYGLNAGGDMELHDRWSATINSSYIRTSNVDGTGHGGNVFSLLFGPVFYFVQDQDTRLFVHALAGPAVANSAASISDPSSQSWAAKFSYAIGAGAEQTLRGPLAVRINADYVGKPYVGSPDIVGTVSLVYHLQPRIH